MAKCDVESTKQTNKQQEKRIITRLPLLTIHQEFPSQYHQYHSHQHCPGQHHPNPHPPNLFQNLPIKAMSYSYRSIHQNRKCHPPSLPPRESYFGELRLEWEAFQFLHSNWEHLQEEYPR